MCEVCQYVLNEVSILISHFKLIEMHTHHRTPTTLPACWLLQCVGAVRMPSEAEIGSFIPSQRFPSDHLAVVYDLRVIDR